MKKLFGFVCLLMTLMFATSCSEKAKMEGLLEKIPTNADVVIVGNVKNVLESAGGSIENSRLKLPSKITNALPDKTNDELDKINDILKKSGIDLDACAIVVNYQKAYPMIIFNLEDQNKFKEKIEDNGYRETDSEGPVTFYKKKVYESSYDSKYDDYGYCAVDGQYAYWIDRVWVGSDFKPIKYMKKFIDDAKEQNMGGTNRGSYLLSGNAGGVSAAIPRELQRELRKNGIPSDIVDPCEGYVCFKGDLSANKCSVNIKLFDEDDHEVNSKRFNTFINTSATINRKALAYLGEDEVMLYAVSLKDFDWEKYIETVASATKLSRSERAQINAFTGYLEKIDGTVAFGFGINGGLETIQSLKNGKNLLSKFSTTIVIETKEGKAKQLINDMKGLLEEVGMPFVESADGFTIKITDKELGGKLYVEHIDNFIVAANHPINENRSNIFTSDSDLSDNLLVFSVNMSKRHQLMRDLNIKNDVKFNMYCKGKSLESGMILEIEGDSNTGVIAKAINIIMALVEQSDDLMGRSSRTSYDYDDYSEDTIAYDVDDVEIVDSVACVEYDAYDGY